MAYSMYRVFCATPGNLEQERQVFHNVIAQLNENAAMPDSALLVPVSILPNMVDTLFFRSVIEENIQDCAFFVQVLDETWGPSARNFQWKYDLACKLKGDPDSLMLDVAVFFKERDERQVEDAVRELKASLHDSSGSVLYHFESIEQFKEQLRLQLSAWLRNLTASAKAS
jgi:hypothetical protein